MYDDDDDDDELHEYHLQLFAIIVSYNESRALLWK